MKILVAAVSCLSFLFFFQIYPNYTNTNEQSRFLMVSAIGEDHTFRIDRAIERYGDTQDKTFVDGHFYAAKSIGYSLLAVPFYLLLTTGSKNINSNVLIYFLRVFVNMIPLLLFTVFFFRYLRDSLKLNEKSYLLIAAFLFGTLVYPYAQLFMSHLLTGLCWFVAFYLVCEGSTRGEAASAGMLLGISFLLEFPSVLVIAACGFWLLLFKRNLLIAFCMGAAIFSLPAFLYNWYYFGGPLEWPYKHT